MTAHVKLETSRPIVSRWRVAVVLLVGAFIVGGCGGTSVVARPKEPVSGGVKSSPSSSSKPPKSTKSAKAEKPAETAPPNTIRGARERSALSPDEPYWPYHLGQLYADADSTADAEAALKMSLKRNPNYAPALALLSKIYYDTGRHQEAIEMLEAARKREGGFGGAMPPALLAGLALHYDAIDRPDLAAPIVSTLPRPDRELGPTAVYLTLRGSSPDSATAMASTVLDKDSKSAVNQNNYGITRLRAADPEGARKAFTDAIDRDPKLPGPYYNLAILEKFYMLDDAAAAKWFRLYWERSTEDPDGLAQVFQNEPKKMAGKGEQP